MSPERRRDIQTFLRFFTIAMSNTRMYGIKHPQTERMLLEAAGALRAAIGENPQLSLMILEDHLVSDSVRLPDSIYTERFALAFREHGCSHITVRSGIADEEIRSLIGIMAASREGSLPQDLASISFGTVGLETGLGLALPSDSEILLPLLQDLPQAELDQFREIYEAIRQGKHFHVSGLYNIVGAFIKTFRQESPVLTALAPLRILDEHTFTHSTNVCVLNLAQALSLDIKGQLLHDIGVASLLHDIGKLFIPEEILNKPGKLTEAEWAVVREHPLKGARYLMDNPGVPQLAVVTAFEHHLMYDLSGYPTVAASWEQNICSHMTTISDYFDAMSTAKQYRRAYNKETISVSIMHRAGTDFHPVLAKNFGLLLDSLWGRHT
ncbi:MAG: HD-GYP domain-containing protein [Dissulfurispiraceae bacterium]